MSTVHSYGSHGITKSRDLEIEIESTGNPVCFEDLKSKKAILTDLLGFKAQGVLVRPCFHSIALMDSPSKLFFQPREERAEQVHPPLCTRIQDKLLTEASEIRHRAGGVL